MLHLRRVRFASIGHRDARLAPLDLVLTGEDGRPAHSVLWLRNGGGKSSILNLLFSVLRPDRREFLGIDENGRDRSLADYVAGTDTAHVILEWGPPRDREPTWVTGMVLEWRDHVRSADRDRLRRLWYGFVPTSVTGRLLVPERVLGLDTLPVHEDGARLSLARFRERLREEALADPGRQLVLTDVQAEWRRALEDRRLDPEVFRYQLAMNREEGGASQLFKRRSRTDATFVDLLLELALPDDQPAQTAAVFHRYADELTARPDLERNRDFLSGALERLGPLVVAVDQQLRAEGQLDARRQVAARVAAGLARAADLLRDRQVLLGAQADEALAAAREEEQRAEAHAAAAAEATRRAAGFRLADAERAAADALARSHAADAGERAWQLVQALADEREATAEAADLVAQLSAAEDAALPLRAQRDEAGARLSARLAADAAALTASAAAADQHARDAERAAEVTGEQRDELATRRGATESELVAVRQRLSALRVGRVALEGEGLIAEDEPLEDAVVRLGGEAAAVDAAVQAARERNALLVERGRATEQRREELDARRVAALQRQAVVHAAQQDLQDRVEALLSDPRLVEVAETAEIALFAAGAALAERLSQLAAEAERHLLDEELGAAADRRALSALDTDGLLPGRPELLEARDALSLAGIAAVTGWRYLADSVPAAEHEAVLDRHPELVDGVVLVDPSTLDRARAALSAAGLRPAAAVVVGLSAALNPAAAQLAAPTRFLVPPSPALADRVAGESERAVLGERIGGLDERAAELRAARQRDTALAERLRALLADHPEAERERLAAEVAAADDEHIAVTAATGALRDERAALVRARDALEREREALEERAAVARRASVRLAALAAQAQPGDPADDLRLQMELDALVRELDGLQERGRAQRAQAGADAVRAAQHRNAAERLRVRATDLHLPPAPDGTEVGEESGAMLERTWRLLDERYRGAVTDPVLEERLGRARQRGSAAGAVRERAAVTDVTAASALLATGEGGDVHSRVMAREAAERAAREALAERIRTQEREQRERDALPPAPAQAVTLAPEPVTQAAAEVMAAALAAHAQEATAAQRSLRARAAAVQAGAQQAGRDAERLSDAHERLADVLPGETGVEAAGPAGPESPAADVPAALESGNRARGDLRVAEQHARAAQAAAQSAASGLRAFVLDRRFDPVEGPLRDRLGRDADVALAERAGQYAGDVELRLAQCTQQLASLNGHRDLLVRQMADRVAAAVHLLRQAERASQLPDGFGEWSGQSFLHIGFDRLPADEELFARLAVLLDGMVDAGQRPEGLPLVQQAVHAAVGGRGFRVRILKPNAALRSERVPVSDLATFSGGEQLTAAVLLYCTLSQMRARLRGQRGTGGVLVLDNPIGKSSNVTLLDLQRRVAEGLDVQLVYTTAVDDRDAVAALPNRIRLRNARVDRRTGNAHVELEDPDSATGQVTAARLWRREPGSDEGAPHEREQAEELAR